MITVILQGGLGNQLFQYATAKALSLKLDTTLNVNTSFFSIHKNKSWCRPYELFIFQNIVSQDSNKLWVHLVPFLRSNSLFAKHLQKTGWIFDGDNLNKAKKNSILYGYFQKESYFSGYREEILKDFVFIEPLNSDNQTIADQIAECNSVSIHIRRGDYLNSVNSHVFAECSLSYFQQAIEYIKNNIKTPHFFFFSDDLSWVKNNFASLESSHFIDINHGKNSYNDMRLMSLCKHNIITNSTFSWWSAWLNQNPNKIVIAPKHFYKNEIKNKEIITSIYPTTWTLL